MPPITHLQLVSVPVSDQDEARSFYVETLGFELLRDQPMGPGQRWVEVAPPGGQASVALVTWFPTMPPGSVQGLVLATGEVDRARAELGDRGVVFRDPLTDSPWGRWSTFADPDGNGWVLQQNRDRITAERPARRGRPGSGS